MPDRRHHQAAMIISPVLFELFVKLQLIHAGIRAAA